MWVPTQLWNIAQCFTLAQLCEGSWDYANLVYMCFVYLEKCASYIVGGTVEEQYIWA